MGKNSVVIKQKLNEPEVATEIIAQNIVQISEGVKRMRAGRLNDKAIIYLIHKNCGVPQIHIETVLNSMQNLAKAYLK